MKNSIHRPCPHCKKPIKPGDLCCYMCAQKIRNTMDSAASDRIQYVDSASLVDIPMDYTTMPHLKKYGLTPQDYEHMLTVQSGKCAICRKPPNRGELLVVDHCHYSGVVRELLCTKCNVMLGFANDNIELLQKSIEYLKKHTT